MITSSLPPWKKPARHKARKKTKLPPEYKQMARERAQANGRRYPNLIDNMWATEQYKKHNKQ